MKDLIKIASEEIGIKEVEGEGSNPRILEYAKEVGFDSWFHDDDTPWCSLFLNWVAMKAGVERSHDGRASSWQNVGKKIVTPEPGDIGLFSPTPGGTNVTHVGIFTGYSQDKSRIYLLGGNQSDMVNISGFKTDTLVEFRRLTPEGEPDIVHDEKILRRGDRGNEVVALQDALKLAGFDCGTSDGIFGRMTETAVMALQATNLNLSSTGIYDAATRAYLVSLIT